MDITAAMARMKKIAAELDLPWGERKRTFNSRLAQELGKWAESKGRGDLYHDAVFRAYFAEGKNIAKTDVLTGLARAVGLPADEAGEVMRTRTFKASVDSDWALVDAMEITSVPTFALHGRKLVGAEPYAVLEEFLLGNGVKKR